MTLRIAIWGPGQVGRAVLRAAQRDPGLEVVAVKARRERPDGISGVPVTTSKQDILDLRPDCVVMTPAASAIFRGIDDDVIDLLEHGSNVVSTTAYHSPLAQNWASASRASAERLAEACHRGGTTLHGTGVHPTFMVERVVLTLAQMLDEVEYIRFVEAADFTRAGEMWGGLTALGFGLPLDRITAEHPVARGGDLYYGDVIVNVADALFGADPDEVRIEREYRALPATHDAQLGDVTIAAGTTGAVHLLHHGYLGDRRFFTNEECWYLRDVCTFRGDDLPFGGFGTGSSYTAEVHGTPATIRSQIELEPTGNGPDPITNGSVRAVLQAISAVCAAAPGILVDDARPHYRHVETAADPAAR